MFTWMCRLCRSYDSEMIRSEVQPLSGLTHFRMKNMDRWKGRRPTCRRSPRLPRLPGAWPYALRAPGKLRAETDEELRMRNSVRVPNRELLGWNFVQFWKIFLMIFFDDFCFLKRPPPQLLAPVEKVPAWTSPTDCVKDLFYSHPHYISYLIN